MIIWICDDKYQRPLDDIILSDIYNYYGKKHYISLLNIKITTNQVF
jgi:hypothetical protein